MFVPLVTYVRFLLDPELCGQQRACCCSLVSCGLGPLHPLFFFALALRRRCVMAALAAAPGTRTAAGMAAATAPPPGAPSPTTVPLPAPPVAPALATARPLPHTLLPVPSDLAIAQATEVQPIAAIAAAIGIDEGDLDLYGRDKAKVHLAVRDRLAAAAAAADADAAGGGGTAATAAATGRLVVVSGINPTPLGEGKSCTTVGLSQALGAHLGARVMTTMRQPSQGPVWGVKGGAAGGGYSQIVPMEAYNLHLTGDLHAISAANNLLAAAIDTRLFHESTQSDEALFRRLCPTSAKDGSRRFAPIMRKRLAKLGIEKDNPADLTPDEAARFARLDLDPASVTWQRVVDLNDRSLRRITIGQGPAEKGLTRETGFDITVASEIMAIMALATSLSDLRTRLGAIVVGTTREGARVGGGQPVTADDLGVGGALAVLLKDALLPTLMQTVEGTPVLIHTGPFANLAHGQSSVVADQLALRLVGPDGYVLTEAGFGADIGGEKAMNIKCRAGGLTPAAVVLVATVRALKAHGGAPAVKAGTPLPAEYATVDVEMVRRGATNLARHVENMRAFGPPVVVAINKFATDADEELAAVREAALAAGAVDAVVANHWAQGGAGAVALGRAVMAACDGAVKEGGGAPPPLKFTYELNATLVEKIEAIATRVYRAARVEFAPAAAARLDEFQRLGYGGLAVCMAKTQYSFSADPSLAGAPTDFVLPVVDARLSAGAGLVVALCGTIQTMPGLPTRPNFYEIDIDEKGVVVGLS